MENMSFDHLTAEQLERMAAELRAGAMGVSVDTAIASPLTSPQDPYAVTTWGESEYDFRVPSGQLCRMKKLRPEELVGTDLLNRMARLPGLVEEQVRQAEGKPPVPAVPEKEDLLAVIEVLDELLPRVVVKPVLHSVPKADETGAVPARVPGRIYTDDIELADRVAIMERATAGVTKLDNFR